MTENIQHPLTEDHAAELWDTSNELFYWRGWNARDRAEILAILRATFDAGREHEREHTTQGRAAEITDEMVEKALNVWFFHAEGAPFGELDGYPSQSVRGMRAALSAALAVATPADPHHDPRPWQDCTEVDVRKGDLVERPYLDIARFGVAHHQDPDGHWRTKGGILLTCTDGCPLRRIPAHTTEKEPPMPETTTPTAEPLARTLLGVPEGYGAPHHDAGRIKAGDFVLQVDNDGFTRAGIAHRQDGDGDWYTKGSKWITWAALRADRPDALTVWPAPTPPAEEVEMPGEPRRLTDVVLSGGEKIAEAAWTGAVLLYARHPLATSLMVAPADQIEQWTLDGTRARRDGEQENGEPRFVKVREGEK